MFFLIIELLDWNAVRWVSSSDKSQTRVFNYFFFLESVGQKGKECFLPLLSYAMPPLAKKWKLVLGLANRKHASEIRFSSMIMIFWRGR